MRQSVLFTKTRKEAPSDEVAKNAQLLIRAGFIHKEMAGVYSFLPLGLRTLEKIKQVIREEMDAVGGQEIIMSALQDKEIWSRTDRWDDAKVDNWFKTTLKSGGETGLGITHEEPLARIMADHISSYRDLPVYAYQFQNKFRNEMRAKSGIMRGKEFLMKDGYTFSRDEEEHQKEYERVRDAYPRIFKRVGIDDITYRTFADGGIFSDFSEEFQTISDAGEDTIYVHEKKKIAINKEVYSDENLAKLGLKRDELLERKAIETGNVFHLGTRFSEALGLTYKDEEGNKKPVVMGSYGLGPTRLMGTLVEVHSYEKGLVWPKEVAPFTLHLIVLGEDAKARTEADDLYERLTEKGVEVLYDDRDASAGEKFAASDLIGIPYRAVISAKTLTAGKVELTKRSSGESALAEEEQLYSL
ncbi:prolyl-tRNA synthetase [Candidatus Kaiserbacteria bacterium CG10_big_fil_rev_8_21_14_0_10_49_17]|uniref:Proline--tRNA ligase n=1 Tax=Candidatus Kaiserbacteria bacterium CG10_big_fil_rev_8_21_14_0_10_49_17 TaxID=1974609 RepID=A0A2M6WE87_9BACT|nr:MAG: prolyl-tRNA synthetase [Candidatus Kaiserbacteria bacterium CG10_big_fil_rev_8_21_14_0_10_49_17]